MIRKIQSYWRTQGITRKLRIAFGSLVLMIILVFSVGYIILNSFQTRTADSILNSQEINRMVLMISWKLEESRSIEKNFFLQYPVMGFERAYNEYVRPAMDLAEQAEAITSELRPLLKKTQIMQESSNHLKLLFMAQQRHVNTLNESTDLVAELVAAESGLEQKLLQNLLFLKKIIKDINHPDALELFQKMQTFSETYILKRRRPIMQSSFNIAVKLRDKLEQPDVPADRKMQAITCLNQYLAMGKKMIRVDVTLRRKMEEFRLQAVTLKTISSKMLTIANQENEKSKKRFHYLDRFMMGAVFLITSISLILIWLTAGLLGKSITFPIIELARMTREFEKGSLETQISIENQDELGELANSYNRMAVRLKELINTLEQKILERTQHLNGTLSRLKTEVAEHQRAEEELKASENRFRDISQSMADWIWEIDENSQYTYVSDSVKKVLGYSAAELIGKQPFDLLPEEDKDTKEQIFNELISKSKPIVDFENWNLSEDGTWVCLITNGVPILDKDGAVKGYRGVNKDITKQKNLEKERTAIESRLHQAQKMEAIGVLAGGIAHDFNNILFPIIGYTEMLMEDISKDSPFREDLEGIYKAALRARDLVQQILAFAHQDENDMMAMKLQPVIKEALKLIRATIPTTISISHNLQPDCDTVKAAPTQIHQIIMNLATNAYHAMQVAGGELKVSLKEIELSQYDRIDPHLAPGVYACLAVADTGTGMDKQLTQKIFDPFFTTKKKGKGTGLGLSVVHNIVKSMNGAVKVYSEPGQGSEFHVYLPIVADEFNTKASRIDEPVQRGTESVLLVDDEKSIIVMVGFALERLGYQVHSNTSSIEAFEAFKTCPDKYDIVITDMAMPKMSGEKLAVELINIRPDVPILLCTGFSEAMTEKKILDLGVRGVLLKPVMIKDLAKKIREVLDNSSVLRKTD